MLVQCLRRWFNRDPRQGLYCLLFITRASLCITRVQFWAHYCLYSVFDIRSLTWDERSYPEGVLLPIVTLGTIRPEASGVARNATEFQH